VPAADSILAVGSARAPYVPTLGSRFSFLATRASVTCDPWNTWWTTSAAPTRSTSDVAVDAASTTEGRMVDIGAVVVPMLRTSCLGLRSKRENSYGKQGQ
jgi:hypothetical protein